MCDLFRNIVFVLVAGGCLLVTGLNHFVTINDAKVVRETFTGLAVQQNKTNQIEDAQTYGMKMGQIAFYETFRAAELIASLEQRLNQMELQAELYDMSLEAQGSYIQQLIDFIKNNDLTVPVPVAVAKPTQAESYHESLLNENGYPAQ